MTTFTLMYTNPLKIFQNWNINSLKSKFEVLVQWSTECNCKDVVTEILFELASLHVVDIIYKYEFIYRTCKKNLKE